MSSQEESTMCGKKTVKIKCSVLKRIISYQEHWVIPKSE